ncbi:hypothetical protein EJ06DRAFT_547086 [Trichodelitschia bisporula]|uniref:Uncharacterized protein n=1 Tax=Trichodelitschia bisporula TaxID=703511 RepID=A0A6G1I7M4_9PEZI|nr:hypothetical protein EJ06DRAFT_547086 [Trichodelitschia bisporula]
MTFCSSLRRRPSCGRLVAAIVADESRLGLKENSLQTHDLQIPLSRNDHLSILIVSPDGMSSSREASTIIRIERLAALTGCAHTLIVFLFPAIDVHARAPAANALSALQLRLCMLALNVPAVVLDSPEKLGALVTQYRESRRQNGPKPQVLDRLDLVRSCTMAPPMSDAALLRLTEAYPSFADMACMGADPRAKTTLEMTGMDEAEAEGMLAFWKEEWAVG